ncbi:hypothetical protein SLS62_006947 [Diatrype stigma]|uniref:Cytochrome P450 n=1 Tax=Diatrype stigma TaxID=117547 RepID=A0AAN9V090_9PEZI
MIEQHRALLEKMIKARTTEDKHARHDLFSVASGANDAAVNPNESIRMSDIWSEAMSFFPAGAFSSSVAMSAVFFYLSRSSTCYERLADEIRSTFASSEEIKGGPKLSSYQYLRPVIDESMRLAPPVPGTLWREVPSMDDGPTVIDGHVVPPGTQVGVNIYSLHHNEDYFPDAFAFKPERWLASETPEAQRKVMNEAFTPFSIGYRGCAGKAMAYFEMNLVIAKNLWHFDFEIALGKLGAIGAGTPGRTDEDIDLMKTSSDLIHSYPPKPLNSGKRL